MKNQMKTLLQNVASHLHESILISMPLFVGPLATEAQTTADTTNRAIGSPERTVVIDELLKQLNRNYVFPDVGRRWRKRFVPAKPGDMAYNMQALKRATIVGKTTRGGAHGTRPFALTDRFSAGIPHTNSVNPVTKTDWEGTGVKPDVAVPADQALLTAHLLALKKSLNKSEGDAEFAQTLKRIIAAKEKELDGIKAMPVAQ